MIQPDTGGGGPSSRSHQLCSGGGGSSGIGSDPGACSPRFHSAVLTRFSDSWNSCVILKSSCCLIASLIR